MVSVVPGARQLGTAGQTKVDEFRALASHDAWESTQSRCKLVKRHLDLQGSTLKDFVYAHFPEVSSARWGEEL